MKDDSDDQTAIEATTRAAETVQSFLTAGGPEEVFAAPQEHDGRLVWPAAESLTVFGFGLGGGGGRRDAGETGGGGGGGGQRLSRPVAVIVADRNGVTVHPILDLTKIALAGLTAWAFMAAAWRRLRRGRHQLERARDALGRP